MKHELAHLSPDLKFIQVFGRFYRVLDFISIKRYIHFWSRTVAKYIYHARNIIITAIMI